MKDETKTIIRELEEEIDDLITENKELLLEAKSLQDEVDSLWAMMDEMTKSDIENWTHLLDEIKADVITRALMVSKVKGEA
jgi:regulator of replication initiation timing